MNLLQFRQFFRKTSGRYDLVNSDGSDNGANNFINAAQRYLDRLADIPAAKGRLFKEIAAGDYLVKFQLCRAVLEVWCVGTNDAGELVRLPLTRYNYSDLRGVDEMTLDEAYVKSAADTDQDRPTYYALSTVRMMKESNGGIGSMMDVLADGHQLYNGIYLMPPADASYVIEIVGNFYSETLSADTDSSYWTEQHSTLLYAATMRQLEIVHRNREGVRDWDDAIGADIVGIDMDGVTQDVSDIEEMEG